MTRSNALVCSFVACLLALPLSGQTAPSQKSDEPWLDLQSVTLGLRYRMLENHLGSRVQNWSDHHQGMKLRLNPSPLYRGEGQHPSVVITWSASS